MLTRQRNRLRPVKAVSVALGVVASLLVMPAAAEAYTTITYVKSTPAPSIGLIGDSSFAGVRWLRSYEPLKRFNFVLDAESCRRTIATSCRGREGYAPENGITTLRRLEGRFDDVLVMVTGYNDPGSGFADAVDTIMNEAIRQGIGHVVWLTMRTADVSYVSPGFRSNIYTFRDNNKILLQKAQRYAGRLQIADWATYSRNSNGWVTPDGVHLTVPGTYAVTQFIADQVTRVLDGQTITPRFSGTPTCRVGVSLRVGDTIGDVRCLELHLAARGFDITVDRVFDRKTMEAVNFVNYARSWGRDGLADGSVLLAIGAWRAPYPRPFCSVERTLRKGMTGNDVSCLIRRLAALGYHLNNSLGFGQSVEDAVVHYRRHRGLVYGTMADGQVLARLGIHRPTCRVSAPLASGSANSSVLCLRLFVRGLGYLVSPTSYNYDAQLVSAVRAIEKWRGLRIDGVADEQFLRTIGAWRPPAPVSATVTAQAVPSPGLPAPTAPSTTEVTAPIPTVAPQPPATTTTTTTATTSTTTTTTAAPPDTSVPAEP